MAVFKCKMCGGTLEVGENESVVTCSYCFTKQTLPRLDNEKKAALFARANNLRIKSEFDKAAGIYESIIAENQEEAEAYWGLVLCKYGIEYVDDKDGKKVPTCHRTLPTSIMKDEDFQQACENADIGAKIIYHDEAKAIDLIQKKILQIASTEEPYDIFICYKETDEYTGSRTEDSAIAQDIYTALTELGYKVFYARNTLRKVAGTEYEPYIYAALSSAKIMLALGTRHEYYDAVWVKNEWSRFISMAADNPSKVLIPCYKGMDAYDIPEEFSNMQALDMSDMMFFNSLETSVKRLLKVAPKGAASNGGAATASATIDSLIRRAGIFITDGDWKSANEYCEKVLDIDPENATAYLGKLMVDFHVKDRRELVNVKIPFGENKNYQKLMIYGDDALKLELTNYINTIINRNQENLYNSGLAAMKGKTRVAYNRAAQFFGSIKGYKDADALYTACTNKLMVFKLNEQKGVLTKQVKAIDLKRTHPSANIFWFIMNLIVGLPLFALGLVDEEIVLICIGGILVLIGALCMLKRVPAKKIIIARTEHRDKLLLQISKIQEQIDYYSK